MNSEYSQASDAAFALLLDATQTLLDCDLDFVVVGGWVPFLFHTHLFGHPGTYDVESHVDQAALIPDSSLLVHRGFHLSGV